MKRSTSLLARLLVLASGSTAAAAPDYHDCVAVADPAKRLACYDAAFPPHSSTQQVQNLPALPAVTTPAQTQPPPTEFGFTAAQLHEQQAKAANRPDEPQEIRATVRDLVQRRGGEFIVTLEDGQRWRQIELNSKARIKPGDSVLIRRAAFGSYLLVTTQGIGTRVRRLD